MGLHIVVKDDHDDAAVVVNELLHLGVHDGPLLVIGLPSRRVQKVIELRIGPMRFVPRRSLGIDRGEHPVAGRPSIPVRAAPWFLQPDIVPKPSSGSRMTLRSIPAALACCW